MHHRLLVERLRPMLDVHSGHERTVQEASRCLSFLGQHESATTALGDAVSLCKRLSELLVRFPNNHELYEGIGALLRQIPLWRGGSHQSLQRLRSSSPCS